MNEKINEVEWLEVSFYIIKKAGLSKDTKTAIIILINYQVVFYA